jgi:hypothetical protein
LNLHLPHISALVDATDGLIVEPNGLVYHGMGSMYGKGVQVSKKAGDVVEVCELGVDHPGLAIRDIGRFPGLHYRVAPDGTWARLLHPDDCDCGTDDHERHIRLLGRIEAALAEGFISMLEPNVYMQRGLARSSDPNLLADVFPDE